ncbi:VOC family protein [Nocardia yunnanensis]|uniref:VOC family protein n=1 Tax=Nocardia yunnanensis TaxID=2382165 RepID=A0A386ZH87_9NOCA|nr:VOC family protein [Nocardia yunnanensis]AYF76871.1 VOC family protein [Nocardia yunnanensis]
MRILGAAITLGVSDPAASSAFFCTHLGFRATPIGDGAISLERDDLDVEIIVRQAEPDPDVQMSFDVADLITEQERLTEEGAPISEPLSRAAGGMLLLRLTDPNQLEIALTQWTPPAGSH